MRFEKGHKDATRMRILEVASRQFKKEGASTGLAGIMAEAGLTNGAFYAHFESKDALFRNALCEAVGRQHVKLKRNQTTPSSWEAFIREYLNEEHLRDREEGCPSAALLPEIGRQPHDTRAAYENAQREFIATLSQSLAHPASKASARRAWATFGLLVGAMQMARAVADPSLSMEILKGAAEAASALTKDDEATQPDSRTGKTRASLPDLPRSTARRSRSER
jgi:AcrR family transcriptional regulator